MSKKITSIGHKGMEGYRVNVEARALGGIETIVIVGLPDAAVKESKDRITRNRVSGTDKRQTDKLFHVERTVFLKIGTVPLYI
jgi:hypothetical protein